MKRFRPLKKGGTVGVFAPGSPARPERVAEGKRYLESLGYRVVMPRDPAEHYGRIDGAFSAASVDERVGAIQALLADESVDVLLAARGAYGTGEILPSLDFSTFDRFPKAVVGFSDLTLLVNQIAERSGVCAVHGPTLTKDFAEAEEREEARGNVAALLALLSDPTYRYSTPVQSIRDGEGEGELIVGNLSVLVSLLGTPFDLSYEGKILVIEEIGEKPYRVHRMLHQLFLARKFDRLQALVLGEFLNCVSNTPPGVEIVLERFVREHLSHLGFPVVVGLPCGHGGKNIALPVGCRARVQRGQFEVVESPIEGS